MAQTAARTRPPASPLPKSSMARPFDPWSLQDINRWKSEVEVESAMEADPFAAAKRASAEIQDFLEADKRRRAQPQSSSSSSAAPRVPSAPLSAAQQASIADEYAELLKATGEYMGPA